MDDPGSHSTATSGATDTRCVSCGNDTRPGTPRFLDRQRRHDGWICVECAAGGAPDDVIGEVPITMPNTNLPGTH